VSPAGSYPPPAADLEPVGRRSLAVGGLGAALCAVGFLLEAPQFFRSYLIAWVLWLGVALGSFAIQMLHHLSRGAWGLMIRRILEAASRTIPAVAVLFLPLLLGLKHLYPWAQAERVAADELLRHQASYLNVGFLIARAAVYFTVWIVFAFALSKLSRRQDETGSPALERRMQLFSAPGLALYCLTMTFLAIDILMSLNPHWYSAIYGVYVVGGQAVSALAFAIIVALFLSRREPMARAFNVGHFHDYGKLLLAFTMLWAYFGLSQFLIIWSGDLPEEIGFYKDRLSGGWGVVSMALVLFHFALPFVLLLSRDLKRDSKKLAGVAVLLLVMRWVDIYWLVAPAFHPERLAFHWLDIVAPFAVGGIWVWLFVREVMKRPLLPLNDSGLPAALEVHAHG
jgi:hypothetical protein